MIIDNTSPLVLVSKYFIGNLSIFRIISFLSFKVNFCEISVIVKFCIKENKALIKYKINKVIAISPIFPKLIPLPPDILLINPLNISVVAFPKILGPTIVNMVLPIANMNTTIKAILYFPK